jgi:hypothetical protein
MPAMDESLNRQKSNSATTISMFFTFHLSVEIAHISATTGVPNKPGFLFTRQVNHCQNEL